MDIEWVLGNNDKIYIVQVRPETVHSQKGDKDIFCDYFYGFSIGSNDLTMLIYGVERDEVKLIQIAKDYNYTTNSEAMRRSLSHLIKTAHEHGKKVGICGQAPSDDPELIEKIRVSRGRLRNKLRKQLREIDPKLKESSEKMDKMFKDLHDIPFNFVKEINTGEIKDFENHYNQYLDRIKQLKAEIPSIRKEISKFGIY